MSWTVPFLLTFVVVASKWDLRTPEGDFGVSIAALLGDQSRSSQLCFVDEDYVPQMTSETTFFVFDLFCPQLLLAVVY